MKRLWLLALAVTLMLALCGCEGFFEQQDKVQEGLLSISEGIESFVEEAGEDGKDIWYGISDFFSPPDDCYTVTFVTGEGEAVEPVQVAKGRKFEANDIPLRNNYHFIGWCADSEPTVDSEYYLQKQHYEIEGDLTLYAIWVSREDMLRYTNYEDDHPGIPWPVLREHTFKVSDEDNVVRIICECENCGLELVDRGIGMETFYQYCGYTEPLDALTEEQQKDFYRKYALYTAREYGPGLVALTELFYADLPDKDNLDAVDWLDPLSEYLEIVGSVSEWDGLYGLLESDGKTMSDAVKNRITAENFFNNLGADTEKGTKAIALVRACCYFSGAVDGQRGIADQTVNMLKALEVALSYTPTGGYYSKLLEVLQEGVTLWDECVEHEQELYKVLDACLDQVDHGANKDLMYYIHSDYVTVLDEARNNVFGPHAPSALEVIARVMEDFDQYRRLSNGERALVNYYITQYLDYHFQSRTGITLEEYIVYWKDSGDNE